MNKVAGFIIFSVLIATVGLGSSSVLAKGGGHGGGMPPGFSEGEKKGWEGQDAPAGWSEGKKKGWGEADVPPGLSAKGSENRGKEATKKNQKNKEEVN